MNEKLPLSNWSLKRLLATETGTFNLARIRILYFIIIMSFIKIFIAIATSLWYDQPFQLTRALITLVLYIIYLKLLLSNKAFVPMLTHFIVITGILLACSIVFISAQRINIVTLQFVFMVILCSFYLLNRIWGIIYSILAVLPVILFMVLFHTGTVQFSAEPNELAYPGQFLITLLNFITFTVAHYLYREAFNKTIEEKQLLNERLEVTLEETKNLAQSKSDFLSTMSHELRTPLNMVIGMTELLRDTPHNEEQEENLRLLNFAAVNLHSLINDILDYNKFGAGKVELEKINVNLSELMQSICSGMQIQGTEKGLKLNLEVDPSLKNQFVITDPTRLSQIIYNIMGNGIKFTSIGEVTLSLKPKRKANGLINILFSVKDTGIGISPDKQEVIFDPFVQASTNTTRNYGGTGLGLSIVKQLLKLFNSTISLESIPGKGSRFYFDITFPIGQSVPSDIKRPSKEQEELKGLRVLVAEDNPLNAFLIRKLCAKWKIDPVIVVNGKEALIEIQSAPYDVLLMDLHMPEMDGYDSARAIRNTKNGARENLVIVALTASVSGDLEEKITAAGMDDFVRKPFNINELYLKLKMIGASIKKN